MANLVGDTPTESLPFFQSTFSLEEFARRRAGVSEAIGDGVAVLQGSAATGAMDVFRQHNDFFYLCGVEVPHAYLAIPGQTGETVLYLPPRDGRLTETDGPELNCDEADIASRLTGIKHVRPLQALASDLHGVPQLFVCRQAPEGRQACQDSINDGRRRAEKDPCRPKSEECELFAEMLREHVGQLDIADLSPILASLRRLKSPAEIEVMRIAGQITVAALCEAIRCTQPGLLESQLAAVAEYVFLVNGATGGAYRPIVASGANIWNMHYYRNNCRLMEGDLVLFDYAPDYSYYTSDIGRMWPVGGQYTPWQRELYGFVVDYHLTLLDLIEPGKTPKQIRDEAASRVGPSVSRTHWSDSRFGEAIERLLATSKALTHSVGMSVHDQSGYQDDNQFLEPGLVFALDPQLWVPELRLYMRVEDNVVVTDSGVENLTPGAPYGLDGIEALMQEEGLLEGRPDLLTTISDEGRYVV